MSACGPDCKCGQHTFASTGVYDVNVTGPIKIKPGPTATNMPIEIEGEQEQVKRKLNREERRKYERELRRHGKR